jgi:hypothetical protein
MGRQSARPCILLTLLLAMHPDAPYLIILLCLMSDDFTCQGESAATKWFIKWYTPIKQHGYCIYTCFLQSFRVVPVSQLHHTAREQQGGVTNQYYDSLKNYIN